MLSVLILSCDAYEDTWYPFFILKNKYWKACPYKTYIMTETKDCEYAETIKVQGAWTKRFREALKQIPTDYVLIMLDDFFIRDYVDQDRINKIKFDKDIAVFNFEKAYNMPTLKKSVNGFNLRPNRAPYLNSCQPSVHNKKKLLKRLKKDQTPWEWELTTIDSNDEFYINTQGFIIDIGYYHFKPWSIKGGKWCKEIVPFFEKEGIAVDYGKRGFHI